MRIVFLATPLLGLLISTPGFSDDSVDAAASGQEESEQPYWYQPGHPVDPAEAAGVTTLPGFELEKFFDIPDELGSWTAIATDHKGRLICAAQHQPGLYRLETEGVKSGRVTAAKLTGAAETMGWCHGLLVAFDSLYVVVAEGNDTTPPGLYRLTDADGDDQYDQSERIVGFDAVGEHAVHNLVVGPDGESLYLMCGNGTPVPETVDHVLPSPTDGIDHLMPPGFELSRHTTAGFVLKLRPDGSEQVVICGGLRNSYDLAFNRDGDLFTFDSDMEWDLGAPWYRPTRVCHLVGGGEFGWRNDAAKWPEYYEDSCRPVLNIGPGSPTGVAFGYDAAYPEKYRRALFACDWTFATIYAVHLRPAGASYRATYEEFVGGSGLPVTDMTFGGDGAMYFIVGGRRLGSAVYRVAYVGDPNPHADDADDASDAVRSDVAEARRIRRELESFHGREDAAAVTAALPHLGSDDRAIRFAARVAIEAQPIETWRAAIEVSNDPATRIMGSLALARKSSPEQLADVAAGLTTLNFDSLEPWQRLAVLRTWELCSARGDDTAKEVIGQAVGSLIGGFPYADNRVNRELARLMGFLNVDGSIDVLLAHMKADRGQRPTLGKVGFERNAKYGESVKDILVAAPLVDRMHDAQMLIWKTTGWTDADRTRYFELMADAVQESKGGYWYTEFWSRIRAAALDQIPEAERASFASIELSPESADTAELPSPEGPGRVWTTDRVVDAVTAGLRDRDFERGKRMYAAAKCVTCHRMGTEGKSLGPDLTQVGQRFKIRDIIEATVQPNKAISDQYAVTIFITVDGATVTGRVISRDAEQVTIATNLERPSELTKLPVDDIEDEFVSNVSTMPTELLNALNEDEVLDLVGYLIAGGNPAHPVFGAAN